MGNSASAPPRRETRTFTGPQAIPGRNTARLQMIPDEYSTVAQVTAALRRNGLESCNLIVGIDFTKSNEWSGKRTFGGRSLHTLDDPTVTNPYEDVIESIGQSLCDFDEDNTIPVFGFGDDVTADNSVFTFMKEGQPGFPFESIRARYREIVPNVVMAGPTSFAPIINQAVNIVNQTGQYHILVIIADGQVTRSVDIPAHAISKNEKETIDAITYASHFPLSIVMVGVGDGPWESMLYFDDYLIDRKFDNFQFVEFHKLAARAQTRPQQMAQFALQALMEVPQQYQIIKQMGYLNKGPYQFASNVPEVMVFPTPMPVVPPPTHTYPLYPASTASGGCSTNYSLGPAQPRPPLVTENPPPSYNDVVARAYPVGASPSAPPRIESSPPMQGMPVDRASPSAFAPTMSGRPGMPGRQLSRAELELNVLQEALLCSICEDRKKDTVFQCGHETCSHCSSLLTQCPTCRQEIQARIKRFGL